MIEAMAMNHDAPPRSERVPTLETVVAELRGASIDARITGNSSVRAGDVQQDSRRVSPGDLFVARAGSTTDAASLDRFVRDAIERGAVAVLRAADASSQPPLPVPSIEVPAEQLRAALGLAASAVHGHPSYVVEVLGVTGTNGKTTTTWLLADALDRLADPQEIEPDCVVIGTVGARLGGHRRPTTHTTPEGDELARLLGWARDRGATHAALEVSSHALDQGRLAGTRVRAAAFTNLTQDHLDYHATMERYFEAKARLFHELHPGVGVVWVDDDYGMRLADGLKIPSIRVGTAPGADVRIVAQRHDATGMEATLAMSSGGEVSLRSRLIGAHNLANLSIALGVLIGLGVPAAAAADALGAARPVPGRLELASDPGVDDVTVLVDYAHTPDALTRVLAALRPLTKGRIFCVFGCGGDRDKAKRAPMGQAVVDGADLAIVTSDNPRTEAPEAIVAAVLDGTGGAPRLDADALPAAVRGVHVEVDRRAAIAVAIRAARPGDVVLVAGKGHEDYQIVGTEKRPFDDVAECRSSLKSRRSARGAG